MNIFALLDVPIIFMEPSEIMRWLRAQDSAYLTVQRARGQTEDAVIVKNGTDLYLGYGSSRVFQQDFRFWRRVQLCSFENPQRLLFQLGDEIHQHELLVALNNASRLDQSDYIRL